jgi:hypothetical protein
MDDLFIFGYGRYKHIRNERVTEPHGICGAAGDYPQAQLDHGVDRPLCPRCAKLYPVANEYRVHVLHAVQLSRQLLLSEDQLLADVAMTYNHLEFPHDPHAH